MTGAAGSTYLSEIRLVSEIWLLTLVALLFCVTGAVWPVYAQYQMERSNGFV